MNMQQEDEKLARVLADWRVAPTVDPQFRPGVWARIERARREVAFGEFLRAHAVPCAALLVVSLGLGAWTGHDRAKTRVAAERATLVANYVQGLDARAMQMP
jgi:hypothetical protein